LITQEMDFVSSPPGAALSRPGAVRHELGRQASRPQSTRRHSDVEDPRVVSARVVVRAGADTLAG